MDTNIDKLVHVLTLAREVGSPDLEKETVRMLCKEYGIVPDRNFPKRIEDIRLFTPLNRENKITAIKELRERAMDAGLPYGLKESKDEVDRRIFELERGW